MLGGEEARNEFVTGVYDNFVQLMTELVESGESVISALYKISPDQTEELDLIEAYCQTLAIMPDTETAFEYTEGYIEIIKESGISEEVKSQLISGAATGLCSSILWEIEVDNT